jgi:hypothetical protein
MVKKELSKNELVFLTKYVKMQVTSMIPLFMLSSSTIKLKRELEMIEKLIDNIRRDDNDRSNS